MPPQPTFGGGATETTIGPVVAVILVVAIVLILFLPRKYIIVPVLLSVLLVPQGNVVFVAGVHLVPTRIISLFGWVRLAWIKFTSPGGLFAGRWNSIDSAFSWWAGFRALATILLWMDTPALINQLGFLWTAFGMYFLLRYLIQDGEDIQRVIRVFAIIAAINAAGMIYEHYAARNLFGIILGGVTSIPEVRDGAIRSQGSFAHSILAGTFGATMFPLYLWLWKCGKSGWAALTGFVSSAVMILTSASSTPVLACGATILALCLWPFRRQMRLLRWGFVFGLLALHLVMKAPVWWLIARVDVIGVSSGYHRAFLVDQFIKHFGDWWLIGTQNYSSWGWDAWDLSNQFVAEGQGGGLATFIAFITMISLAFRRVGTARKRLEGDRKQEWLMWLLGTALFAHVVAFFGISYWDQTEIAWFALFAIISTATATTIAHPAKPLEAELVGSELG